MEPEEFLIILIGTAIVVYATIWDEISVFYNSLHNKSILFYQIILSFLLSWKGLVALAIILLPFILYLNFKLNATISDKLQRKRNKKLRTEEEKSNIENILKTEFENLNAKDISNYIRNINSKINLISVFEKLRIFEDQLMSKKQESTKLLKRLKREKELNEFHEEKEKLQKENEEIRKENERLRLEQENKNIVILRELDADKTNVFFREELSLEEIEALHEDGYEDANEYDVREKRIIPVLVRKIMNHSKTHTFLVWSVRQLLEDMGVEDIEEHDTRFPDITFTYNKEEFAIEIETGTLLRKKKQLREKINFLNRKFGWRWLFIVSNKNLLSKYRKLGFATQRSEVAKKIENWINPDL